MHPDECWALKRGADGEKASRFRSHNRDLQAPLAPAARLLVWTSVSAIDTISARIARRYRFSSATILYQLRFTATADMGQLETASRWRTVIGELSIWAPSSISRSTAVPLKCEWFKRLGTRDAMRLYQVMDAMRRPSDVLIRQHCMPMAVYIALSLR